MPADLAPYAILLWLVAVLAVFPSLKPHLGIILIVFSGTMFLPEAVAAPLGVGPVKFPKPLAVSYACGFATFLYQMHTVPVRWPRWFDWPMIAWCLVPLPSVFLNDPPPDGSPMIRDAMAQVLNQAVQWGFPYLAGRLFFTGRREVRDLAVALVVGTAVYVPFCLFEMVMSPQLHAMVYGYFQHDFAQTIRLGGYRPMVFLQHGLAVGLFMAAGAVAAVVMRTPARLPTAALLLVPFTLLVRSTGAIILVAGTLIAYGTTRVFSTRIPLVVLAAVPPAYSVARSTGVWDGSDLVSSAAENIETDRANSISFRLENEELLMEKALRRPAFGWGGWGRNHVFDNNGNSVTVTDGLWVIFLGDRGIVGLTVFGLAMLGPVLWFAVRVPFEDWYTPGGVGATVCALAVVMWCVDSLFNAMSSAIYVLMAGALAGYVCHAGRTTSYPRVVTGH